jgi:three-Cys-motif partner protein
LSHLAPDGLLTRPGGIWTREKLTYLEKYATAFMTAMAKKRWDRLIYVDLLCGPGRDLETETGEEFLGSPLIALSVKPHFSHLYLADKSEQNIRMLEKRISESDKSRVTLRVGDCNDVIDEVLAQISGRTLGLVFLDPQGFEVKFRIVIPSVRQPRWTIAGAEMIGGIFQPESRLRPDFSNELNTPGSNTKTRRFY